MIKIVTICAMAVSAVRGFITRADYFYRKDRPMLVAHRGSYGYYPEHALGGYVEAYYFGVDYLELDINLSKDGVPIIVHDKTMEKSTNILQHEIKFIDKKYHGLYYFTDFTLEELRTINLK